MMEKTEQGLGRLCVIGDPVEHSKSPLIQNAMIAKLGIPYHYTKPGPPGGYPGVAGYRPPGGLRGL